jgi:hypothetical protein
MAIYPLPFPNKSPALQRLWLVHKQTVHQSPFSGKQQQTNLYAQWNLEFTWPRMSPVEADGLDAWLSSLEGQNGTFTYTPVQDPSALTGRALNQATFAESNTIEIAGWTANQLSTLRVGQFAQIGTQLIRLTAVPLNADANGNCVVEFAPRLRSNYPRFQSVVFTNPKGLFRLATSDTPSSTMDPDHLPEFPPITAVEVL